MKLALATAALALLPLLSCAAAGTNFDVEDARRVEVGMTGDEVKALLGEPNGVHVTTDFEVWSWVYVESVFGSTVSKSFAVRVQDGKVAGIQRTKI